MFSNGSINGFLCVNKPKGITSFDVIRKLRKVTGIKKIGHAGTLDPMAVGVLVIAFNEATKLIDIVMGLKKEYEAEIVLGSTSDTYDAEGELLKKSEIIPTIEEIQNALSGFMGEIWQIPPKFSAIKVNGKRAYDLARKGEQVELKPRKVMIYKVELLRYRYPFVYIKVECGKGTYIRSIANDFGEKLGVGAYLNALKRIFTGEFGIDGAFELDEITGENFMEKIIPLEKAVIGLPRINIGNSEFEDLCFGKAIYGEGVDAVSGGTVCAFLNDKLVGILERFDKAGQGMIKFKRKLNV